LPMQTFTRKRSTHAQGDVRVVRADSRSRREAANRLIILPDGEKAIVSEVRAEQMPVRILLVRPQQEISRPGPTRKGEFWKKVKLKFPIAQAMPHQGAPQESKVLWAKSANVRRCRKAFKRLEVAPLHGLSQPIPPRIRVHCLGNCQQVAPAHSPTL